MQRQPEPELMDTAEQAEAYAAADFEQPHAMFVERFRAAFPDLTVRGQVLDLGCGPADISLRFARAYPQCRIDGVDGAQAMLACGERAVAGAGLQDRVRLVLARLPCEALPRAAYDIVISNSLLHHLADPMVLWNAVKRFGAPGAPVFVMDLTRPESRTAAQALVDAYAAGEPEILRQDFFNSLLAAWRIDEVERQLAAAGLGHLTVEAASDRHLIVHGRLPAGE